MRQSAILVVGLMIAMTSPAMASTGRSSDTGPPAHAAAVQATLDTVEQVATQLPTPTSVAQAQADIQRLVPSVNDVLAAGGQPAVKSLATNPNALIEGAALKTLLAANPPTTQTSNSPISAPPGRLPVSIPTGSIARRIRAHAAGCWGPGQYTVVSSTVAYVVDEEDGWCGNGSAMTYLGGIITGEATWPQYCVSSYSSSYTWLIVPSWVHSYAQLSFGVNVPYVGCVTEATYTATFRIAANGYFDSSY